eukprot:569135-Hanusia_phi.AAC.1
MIVIEDTVTLEGRAGVTVVRPWQVHIRWVGCWGPGWGGVGWSGSNRIVGPPRMSQCIETSDLISQGTRH